MEVSVLNCLICQKLSYKPQIKSLDNFALIFKFALRSRDRKPRSAMPRLRDRKPSSAALRFASSLESRHRFARRRGATLRRRGEALASPRSFAPCALQAKLGSEAPRLVSLRIVRYFAPCKREEPPPLLQGRLAPLEERRLLRSFGA